MRWLLITTRGVSLAGQNPGDEFAKIGCENLIRAIDHEATFDTLTKEEPDSYTTRPFDRAVICGMPLFWSTSEQTCNEIWWWERIFNSWISQDPKKLLALGVGHVLVDSIHNLPGYTGAIKEVLDKCFALVTREPILDSPRIIESICPSAYAIADTEFDESRPSLRICNFMKDCSHFGHLPEAKIELDIWNKKLPEIVEHLKSARFHNIAHSKSDLEFAKSIGFESSMYFSSAEAYLKIYSRAQCYFGNRMHGAAVCASKGIPTIAVGLDSRLRMVDRLGGIALLPSELKPSQHLSHWLRWRNGRGWDVENERARMLKLLQRFAEGT